MVFLSRKVLESVDLKMNGLWPDGYSAVNQKTLKFLELDKLRLIYLFTV